MKILESLRKTGLGCSLTAIMSGESTGSALARWLLIPVLLVPFLLHRLVTTGLRAGWYGEPLASALHIAVQTLFCLGLVGLFGYVLSRIDSKRRRIEQEQREKIRQIEQQRHDLISEFQRQRSLLSAILAQMPVGVTVAEAGSERILLTNDALFRIFGSKVDYERGLGCYAQVQATQEGRDFSPEDWPLVRTIREQEVVVEEEIQICHPDGSTRVLSVSSRPVFDAAGVMKVAVALTIDITANKVAQEALRSNEEALKRVNEELEQRVARRTEALRVASLSAHQSETRYRSLVTASAQIIWTTDPQGEVVTDMPTWRAFTGQSYEAIQGWGWSSALHPDDLELTTAVWSKAVASYSLYETEYRIRRHDGEYRNLAVRGVPVLDDDHCVREWVGACTDITEQKLDEKRREVTSALLKLFATKTSSKAYLDGVVEVLRQWTGCHAMGIRIADKSRNISYESSAGFEQQFLDLECELNLEHHTCLCVRAILQKCEEQEVGLLTGGGSFRCENIVGFSNQLPMEKKERYRGNCAKFGFASLAILPIRYRDRILGAIHLADRRQKYFSAATVQYIEAMSPLIGEAIQRFQAEAELNRYRNQLEDLVKHRTAELENVNSRLQQEVSERTCAQENLRQTADELARSNQDLEQFAYVASHDLQEPLRAVSGYVQLLERRYPEKLDAKGLQYIREAVDGAERMQRLINDLLAFSRVGTRCVDFQPADLNAIFDNTLNNLKTSIRESGATVTKDLLPTLAVDATQLGQLLQNLIGNAIKFRGEQSPEIHVGAKRQENGWHFSVKDNGIGIEPQYFERVFQIFQRLHTRKLYSGTGIGLAICKKIVERHGGTIWIESQLGQGTTFHFIIPVKTK